MLRRFILLCGLAAGLCISSSAQVPAGFVNVHQEGLLDAQGNLATNVTVCAEAKISGRPISVTVGNGLGTTITKPVCTALSAAGAWNLNLPDTCATLPKNATFSITATDNVSGDPLLAGYDSVQPTKCAGSPNDWCDGSTCSFNKLPPNLAGLAVVQQGPTGQTGPQGKNGSNGQPWNFRGAWSSTTSYANGDSAMFNSTLYFASAGSTGKQPDTNAALWTPFTGVPSACPIINSHSVCLSAAPYNVKPGDDLTVALRQAISDIAAAGGGRIFIPAGSYNATGFTDTTGANSIFPMPAVALGNGPSPQITITGSTIPVGYGDTGGTIITTSTDGAGSMFGGFIAGGPYGGMIATNLRIENLRLNTTSANPCLTAINGQFLAGLQVHHVWVSSTSTGVPTCTTGLGVRTPTLSNNVNVDVDDVTVVGFYSLALLSEHANVGHLMGALSHLGYVFDTETGSDDAHSTWGNTISVANLWAQQVDHFISAGHSQTTINVEAADMEAVNGTAIYDPSNLLRGVVNVNVPYKDSRPFASSPTSIAVTGGGNLRVCNLKNGACFFPGEQQLESWAQNEADATTFFNKGTDARNVLTTTRVTHYPDTVPGGQAAFYGSAGAISFAVAAQAGPTAFDGTRPFHVGIWEAPSQTADMFLVSNLDASLKSGFALNYFSGGRLGVYVASNLNGGNALHVFTASPTIQEVTWQHDCFTYDASGKASGVAIFHNGVPQMTGSDLDNLSGSTATTVPVYIGALGGQLQPYYGLMGRVTIGYGASDKWCQEDFNAGPFGK